MKRNAKRLLCLLLACCLLAAVSACAKPGPRVVFFLYDAADTFISEMMGQMEASIPAGFAHTIRDAANSQAIQNQQIVEELDNGADLLVINAVDRLACSSIVEKCAGRGVGVIFFNREPLEDAMEGRENVFYVGAAADSLGEKQADIVAELFGNNFAGGPYDKNDDGVVQLVILKGEQGHQDAEKRTDNCVSRLKALGFAVEVLAIEPANWTRREGAAAMERLWAQYGNEIELVFANNDDMALGAIDYMRGIGAFEESAGGHGRPFVVVGVDGTAVGLEAISEGLLYGTVQNDSAAQADAIIDLTQRLLNGGDLTGFPYEITGGHYIFIDGEIITRANVGEYATSVAKTQ